MTAQIVKTGRRQYEAAMLDRLTAGWTSSNASADLQISGSLLKLRSRSYQLCRDNGYARNVVRLVCNNVAGSHGIRLQPTVKAQRGGKLQRPINDQILGEFHWWSRPKRCHVAGRYGWAALQRLILSSVVQAGEVFVRIIEQPFGDSRVPMALEVIEPDLCDERKTGVAADGTEWRMGVRVDKWGRPLGYWFLDHHPMDLTNLGRGGGKGREVPADEVLHLFVPDRPGQTRGVPWMVTAARRLHQMAGTENAHVERARAAACLMGIISNPDGEPVADDVVGDQRLEDFEAAMFKYLAPGESITPLEFNAPAGELAPFMRYMLQGISAGTGISYAPLSQDYSQTNYSSSRLSQLDDREQWRVLQDWLEEGFCQPVYEAWLAAAVDAGVIRGVTPALFAADAPRLCSCKWRPRGWQFVDPQKEGNAAIAMIEAGLKTRAEVMAEQGRDFEETVQQLADEKARLDELGLSVAAPVASEEPMTPDDGTGDETETAPAG